MKTYITKMKQFVETDNFKRSIKVVGILAVITLIFQAGVFMGFRKASFYGEFGNNFRNNFEGDRGEFRGMMGRDIPNAHGVVGNVIDVALPSVVIAGDDGVEKIIFVDEKTIIRKFREDISADKLIVGDNVVVVGNPGRDGIIDSRLIRIMPAPLTPVAASSTNLDIK
ncbi:MAG TPA: hypothetical protein P5056_03120 [Candidatus Paceibacterota bacterium]|nr:hypothetical protein [Candidatus Paceibacterota bacterium]